MVVSSQTHEHLTHEAKNTHQGVSLQVRVLRNVLHDGLLFLQNILEASTSFLNNKQYEQYKQLKEIQDNLRKIEKRK